MSFTRSAWHDWGEKRHRGTVSAAPGRGLSASRHARTSERVANVLCLNCFLPSSPVSFEKRERPLADAFPSAAGTGRGGVPRPLRPHSPAHVPPRHPGAGAISFLSLLSRTHATLATTAGPRTASLAEAPRTSLGRTYKRAERHSPCDSQMTRVTAVSASCFLEPRVPAPRRSWPRGGGRRSRSGAEGRASPSCSAPAPVSAGAVCIAQHVLRTRQVPGLARTRGQRPKLWPALSRKGTTQRAVMARGELGLGGWERRGRVLAVDVRGGERPGSPRGTGGGRGPAQRGDSGSDVQLGGPDGNQEGGAQGL